MTTAIDCLCRRAVARAMGRVGIDPEDPGEWAAALAEVARPIAREFGVLGDGGVAAVRRRAVLARSPAWWQRRASDDRRRVRAMVRRALARRGESIGWLAPEMLVDSLLLEVATSDVGILGACLDESGGAA